MKGLTVTLFCALAFANGANAIYNDPSQAPEICAAEGSNDILIAHEHCDKFYICYQGVPNVRSCPSTENVLYYNTDKQYCDWPENVDCGDRVLIDEETDEPAVDENEHKEPNTDPSKAPEVCAEDGSNGVLVAHEECDKFYRCWEGLPVAIDCPNDPKLYYNAEREYCDWPENVACAVQKEILSVNPGESLSESSNAPLICAAEGSDGVMFSHEDCGKFYKCSQGIPVTLSCPTNLLYNVDLQYCDWAENVDCGRCNK